ncbi:MAG: NADH-quinone oxidoreductase subunit N [Chloroflexi bacterium]|nr:NADH-quinone oxidoreductase subunit N [Chloroflexota bacterium]
MNLWLLAPELSLFFTAVVVLLLGLASSRRGIVIGVSLLGVLVSFVFAAFLWSGTPQATFNGMLSVDQFAVFFKFIVLAALVLVILASADYDYKVEQVRAEYFTLILISAVGLMLLSSARELITIYVSLEMSSISLYVLAGFLRDRRSSEAGLKYLLLGSVASATLLYGMSFVYGLTGKTELGQIASAIQSLSLSGLLDNPALLLGLVLVAGGFGFKISSFPFQMWVPDVYEGAPTPITGYLSVASKAAGFAAVMRIFYDAFGAPSWLGQNWGLLFAGLSIATMTVGNIVATAQANIKRMMAYSSIAQAGYIMVGLAAVSMGQSVAPAARSALAFFLASYTLTNMGAFVAIIAFSNKTNSDLIVDYSGMGRRAPLLALGLTLCLVSLLGLPPTAGLIAKVYIFNAAVQQGLLWLVIVAVLNTVVSAYYYLRVVKLMWLGNPVSEEPVPSSAALRTALFLACAGILLLGIVPDLLVRLSETAGHSLL